jgi:hypothetical protein
MMRVLAATSADEVQGLRTEAEEVIGDVTADGSLFLILVLGIGAGAAGLALFATLRRWLPDRSLAAGLVGVAIGAGLLVRPSGLIASDNPDFRILDPVALAVALCVALLVLFGATFGGLVDHLGPRWPRPGWSVKGIASVLPFAVLVPAPPVAIAAVIGVLVGTFAPTLRLAGRSRVGPASDDAVTSRFARTAVTAIGVLGSASILVAAGEVLAR